MNYRIGIYDSDPHYCVRLMEYINMRADIPLKCAAFSTEHAIEDYLIHNRLDMLLVGESIQYAGTVRCARLVADRVPEEGTDCIYKYQKADDIVVRILQLFGAETARADMRQRIYSVYSPIGRCGKTSLALGLCNYYKGSLYIGMDAYAGYTGMGMPDIERRKTETFMYYLLSKNEKILSVINDSPICQTSFTAIYNCSYFPDWHLTEDSHVSWLCELIRRKEIFSCTVFDVGSGMSVDAGISECFDCVLIPVLEDPVSREKLKCFKEYVGDKRSQGNITYVKVPDAPYDSPDMRALIQGGGM